MVNRLTDDFSIVVAAREAIYLSHLNDCIYLHPVTKEHLPECNQPNKENTDG